MSEGVNNPKDLLPELDRDYLNGKEFDYEVIPEGGALLLIIKSFQFPIAYSPQITDLLIIIPSGYPNAQLDMFWTNPDVKLANGGWPAASQHHENHGGKSWQRWSRHNTASWRLGVDNLRTFISAIRSEINKGI